MIKGIVLAPSDIAYRLFIEVSNLNKAEYPLIKNVEQLYGIDRRTQLYTIAGYGRNRDYDIQLMSFVERRFFNDLLITEGLLSKMSTWKGRPVALSMLSIEELIFLCVLHDIKDYQTKSLIVLYADIIEILESHYGSGEGDTE